MKIEKMTLKKDEKTTFESKKFYDQVNISKTDLHTYTQSQIKRHKLKRLKRRSQSFYFAVADLISTLHENHGIENKSEYNMLCLGTRNNFERNCFSKYFSQHIRFTPKDLEYGVGVSNMNKQLASKERIDEFNKRAKELLAPLVMEFFLPKSTVNVESVDIAPASRADHVMDFNNLPKSWTKKWDFIYSNSIDHAISATDAFHEWLRVLKDDGVLILGLVSSENSSVNESDCCSFTEEQIMKFCRQQEREGKILIIAREEIPCVFSGESLYPMAHLVIMKCEGVASGAARMRKKLKASPSNQ